MKSYTLSWAGSGATSEIYADSDDDAIEQARLLVGDDAVFCDSWDQNGVNDDDEQCKRLLIWSDEANAENDDGSNAIAELSTVGSP